MRTALLSFSFLAAVTGAVHAGTVLSDDFNYSDGNLTQVSGGLWIPHNNAGGTPLNVSGGQVRLLGSGSAEDDCAPLMGAPYLVVDPSVALYSSYSLIISNVLPTTSGTFISYFKGTNSGSYPDYGARVWVSACDGLTTLPLGPGVYRIGIGNGISAHAGSGQIHRDLSTNTTYRVVTRFVPSTGVATIWLDPRSETDPGVIAGDLGTAERPNRFDVFAYAFQQNAGAGTLYLDQLRVGTAFSDVAGPNTSPTVSTIPAQSIPAGASIGPLSFTIQDRESPADTLLLAAASSNQDLIPDSNLRLGGSSQNRNISAFPTVGQEGTATITVSVSDGVNKSSTTFTVKVGFPWISAIPSQNAVTNQQISKVGFMVGDTESAPEHLTITATSSNPNLVSDANLTLEGTSSNRSVSLRPVPLAVGSTLVTLTVSDGNNASFSRFHFTVGPSLGLVFSDSFVYSDFAQPNALYLASGSPWQTASGTAFQLQVTNGWAHLSRSDSEDLAAPLRNGPFFPSSAVVFYTSFPVRFSELPSRNGNYFLHFKDTETGITFRGRVFASTTNALEDHFRLGVANAGSIPTQFPLDLSLDSTYTVVTRYNSSIGETALWIDPVSELSPNVIASDPPSPDQVGHISLRQSSGIGTLSLGPLKIGTSFSDVLDKVAPTPEAIWFELVNGKLILSWSNPAFSLASAPAAVGPYTRISAASSPYQVSFLGSPRFFRLLYP
jgi:hypothetical protein